MENTNDNIEFDVNRRQFIKKAAYSAPVIVTMAAIPSFASAGSGLGRRQDNRGAPRGGRKHKQPQANGRRSPSHKQHRP